MTALPEWMLTLPVAGITVEEYDRMAEEICQHIEVIDGSIIVSPSQPPRHKRITRRLANQLEKVVPAPWQVATGVDLRLADVPLHNRRPDVLVFKGDPDVEPLRPSQVLLVVEITSKGSIRADRVDKVDEYASVDIPYYWRIERDGDGLICYTHSLNAATRMYRAPSTYSGTLKIERPFPVNVDLGELL